MAGLVGFEHICQALTLNDFDSTGARQRMSPVPRGWEKRNSKPMRAAVMILLFPADDERLRLVLTLRQVSLRGHSGQVSFSRWSPGPAGRKFDNDSDSRNLRGNRRLQGNDLHHRLFTSFLHSGLTL